MTDDTIIYTREVDENGKETYVAYGSLQSAYLMGKSIRKIGSYLLTIDGFSTKYEKIENFEEEHLKLRSAWGSCEKEMVSYLVNSFEKSISAVQRIEDLREILITQAMVNHIKNNVKEYE
jgi:hypothetical protein